MKEVIEFREIGGMTFSEKVIIIKTPQTSKGETEGIMYLLAIIGFFIILYWKNISGWFKKKSK